VVFNIQFFGAIFIDSGHFEWGNCDCTAPLRHRIRSSYWHQKTNPYSRKSSLTQTGRHEFSKRCCEVQTLHTTNQSTQHCLMIGKRKNNTSFRTKTKNGLFPLVRKNWETNSSVCTVRLRNDSNSLLSMYRYRKKNLLFIMIHKNIVVGPGRG